MQLFRPEVRVSETLLSAVGEDDDSIGPSISDTSEHASTSSSQAMFDKQTFSEEKMKQMKIAMTEERQVRVIRAVTFSFITFSAIAVCAMVFVFAKGYDQNEFEIEYETLVGTIQNDVVWEVKYNFALLQQLSAIITSEIMASNQSAPFITMPNFEVTGGFTDGMGGIMAAMFAPLVAGSLRQEWESYSVENQGWLNESAVLVVDHQEHLHPLKGTIQDHETDLIDIVDPSKSKIIDPIPERVWRWKGDQKVTLEPIPDNRTIAPLWQISPAEPSTVNVDLLSDTHIYELYNIAEETNQTVMSETFQIESPKNWLFLPGEEEKQKEPHAFIMERVFEDFTPEARPIGFVLGLTSFRHLFENILPQDTPGIYCVLQGTSACGENVTYFINGQEASFLGYGNLHQGIEEYEIVAPVEIYDTINEDICVHELFIYPSEDLRASHQTNKAGVYTSVVALAFAVTTFCFLVYERLVTKREKTKSAALQVVSSLFPSDVQDKLLKGVHDGHHGSPRSGNMIASFFPNTTVLFADIAGFTAWSSTREPEQVFHLLETVYGAMDQIAVKRGIFKVETVGDCYVAVCGLPEPRKDHAIAMARFARDCQLRMASLAQQLEVALGPDTADLSFRIGMHSGPVTGGVLRGKNARFQLFGDTMNQASRMESTGIKSRIQMSETTAQLLIDGGKAKWLEKRPDKVDVKGKGLQQTYFFKQTVLKQDTASVVSASDDDQEEKNGNNSLQKEKRPSSSLESLEHRVSNKTQRLITWNTAVLSRRVKAIVQARSKPDGNGNHVDLSPKVANQLKQYIFEIALMYRSNPFHNYEHASHVTLSMEKMLSRVENSDDFSGSLRENRYTNDITKDPLAQFAVVYAALIHDVDHTGVSNNQLVKEKDDLAIKYHGKSPAENNSIDLAWSTLMKPEYKDLVKCICQNSTEKERLKNLVMNAVLATDIFDEDLKESRNMRWEQVFGENKAGVNIEDSKSVDALKVMIVLEHLIQASDVAHTMQHWHVYIKWNERLFHEMNNAYQNGRLGMDPAKFWYKGELGFFDFYVIPLAKKLRECGIFGVTCEEFLNYAETNRTEWEAKGEAIVEEYVLQFQKKRDASTKSATGANAVAIGGEPTPPIRISPSPAA